MGILNFFFVMVSEFIINFSQTKLKHVNSQILSENEHVFSSGSKCNFWNSPILSIWKLDTILFNHTIESAFNQERSLNHAGPRKCHSELGGTRFEFVITLLINVNCFVDLNEEVV